MMLNDHILLRFLNKSASPQEIEQVEKWIEASPENRKYFQEWLTVYYESSHLKAYKTFDVDSEWNSFRKVKTAIHKPIENALSYRKIIQYAAVACLALIAAFFFLFPSNSLVSHTTGSEQLTLVLSDNSELTLYPNSTVEYEKDFQGLEERRIKLNGKATFEVTSIPKSPFIVESNLISTKVIGTIFTFDASSEELAMVSVAEGTVSVKDNNKLDEVRILKKGSSISFSEEGFGEIIKPKLNLPKPVTKNREPKVEPKPEPEPEPKPEPKPKAPPKIEAKPEPVEEPEIKLSKYPVNDVLEFLDKQHAENARFSKSRKAKLDNGEFILLNLNEPIDDIIKRLESKYILEYDDEKCQGCVDLKKISKK